MATSGAGVVAAIIQAIKASGVVVRLEPGEFLKILDRATEPLVVVATGGIFRKSFQYLTSYKGLGFVCASDVALKLPAATEMVKARSFWMPR